MNPRVVGAIALAGFIIVVMAFAVPPMLDSPDDVENESDPSNTSDPSDPEEPDDPDDGFDLNVTSTVGPITGPDDEPDPPDDDGGFHDGHDHGDDDTMSSNDNDPSSEMTGNSNAEAV